MTRKELDQLTGKPEQSVYAMELLLEQVKKPMLVAAVRLEIDRICAELAELAEAGWVTEANGTKSASWCRVHHLDGWNLTDEQQAEYDKARAACERVDALIYQWNRARSLLTHL